jgi:alkylhydroperoxidase family enzyme
LTRREQWTAGWHTYARLPGLLNARLNAFKRLYVAPDFPAEAKQIAGMLIAHARRCSGCFSATRTALLRLGFDEPTLDGYCANPAVLPLKERDRLFVQYTLKIATGSADLTPNDLREMEASGFSKTEIQEMMGFAAFWVFVAPATYRLAEGYFRFQTAGPLRLRGMADPVEAHVLEEEGSVVSRLEASLRRGVSPFRGREAQLRALGECWERAVGGQGEAVCLTGEPGIGKSRLIYELRRSLGITSYAEGAALSHARNSAYFLFRQLLCHLAVLDPEADLSAARQHLHRRLWDLSPELAPLVSDILPVFGTTCESLAEGTTDEREDRRDRFQEAVTAWVRAECRREPRLLVLEDLHWLDPSSEELLCHLAAEAHDLPLLLLTTSRFPITGGNLELAKIREILVPALPVEDIHALVDAQVEPYPANPRLRQVVVERAEGNPFFVEESRPSVSRAGRPCAQARCPGSQAGGGPSHPRHHQRPSRLPNRPLAGHGAGVAR